MKVASKNDIEDSRGNSRGNRIAKVGARITAVDESS